MLSGCQTLAEGVCEQREGNLINETYCVDGNPNSTYQYIFVCSKNTIIIYGDKDIDIEMPLYGKIMCSYIKVNQGIDYDIT